MYKLRCFQFLQAGQLYEEENESDFKEKKEYRTVKHFERFLGKSIPFLYAIFWAEFWCKIIFSYMFTVWQPDGMTVAARCMV